MSEVIRVKYRPSAIQPSGDFSTPASMSLMKKEKPVPEVDDPLANLALRPDPVVFIPDRTQVRRVERRITSDEEPYRKKTKPTIHERIEVQAEWAKTQLKRAKILQQEELLAKKQQMERDIASGKVNPQHQQQEDEGLESLGEYLLSLESEAFVLHV
jgi:hypothetical protein